MHGLGKIYAVKNFDFIPPPLQKAAYLSENTSFGIDHHIAASGLFIRAGLQDLRGKPEPGFAGAGRADDAGVKVAGVGRVFGAGIHGKKLRPGENDIVFKLWIDKGLDVFCRSPTGGTVLFIPPVLFRVFAFHIDQQAKGSRAHNANQPVKGSKPRRKVGKGRADSLAQPQELVGEVCASGQPVGRPQL